MILWLWACSPDTDGDGFRDAVEEQAGTNPDYIYSHPYEEGDYSIGYCADGVAEGSGPSGDLYQVGDVADNFTLRDQYEQEVNLYAFCGKQIMIVFGAFW